MKDITAHNADLTSKRREYHRIKSRLIISFILLLIVATALIIILLI